MTRTRFAKVIGASAALILFAAAAPAPTGVRGQGGTTSAPSKPAGAQKQGAPAAAAVPQVREIDETGLKALLDEHAQAGRRLLVNFWATWCTPCREEFPDLVKIDREFAAAKDFEFVTISSDDLSEIGTSVPAFLAEMGAAEMPAYLLNAKDPEAAIAIIDKNWHGDLPATFLFGPSGEILFSHKGRIKPDKLRQAIKDSGKTATSDK